MTAHRHRIGRAAIRIFGRMLLLVLAFELLLRSYLWWRGEQNILQDDQTIGWRVQPNLGRAFQSDEGPYLLETNSRGHRDHEHPENRVAGTRRILLVGSSTVFGDGVDQHHMFSEVLERSLPQSEVINLSIPSVSAEQHFLMLRDEGIKYRPDLVVQFLVASDAMEPFWPWALLLNRPKPWLGYENDEIVIHPPNFGFAKQLLQSSYLCQFGIFFAFISIPHADVTVDGEEQQFLAGQPMSREGYVRSLRGLLRATREICQNHSAEYVVVYLPSSLELSGTMMNQGDFLREEVLSPMEKEENLRVINFLEPLSKVQSDGEVIFENFHLNAHGHQIIGETLARALGPQPRSNDEVMDGETDGNDVGAGDSK